MLLKAPGRVSDLGQERVNGGGLAVTIGTPEKVS